MLYDSERYFEEINLFVDDRSAGDLYGDKVTLALMIASSVAEKQCVLFSDFIKVQTLADNFGSLDVYMNTYGRPVSYITLAYCDLDSNGVPSSIRFAGPGSSYHGYVVDSCITEYSVDDTIYAWIQKTSVEDLTIFRRYRPKAYRTYSISRLRKINWPHAQVAGRFSLPKGFGIQEHEQSSLLAISSAREARHILEFLQENRKTAIELGSFLLVQDLIRIGQITLLASSSGRIGCFIVALTNISEWQSSGAAVLQLPLIRFIDGYDIVVCDLLWKNGYESECIRSAINNIALLGEHNLYIPCEIIPESVLRMALSDLSYTKVYNDRFYHFAL